MDDPPHLHNLLASLMAGSLGFGIVLAATVNSVAQKSGQGRTTNPRDTAAAPVAADRRGVNRAHEGNQKPKQARKQLSQAYWESIRRTIERQRHRRARRGQSLDDSRPVGEIITWPMQPALIIRQTPQVHDEIESLLKLLRK
jgi:hypothetical protein